jgi:hypothetical protein
VETNGGRRLVSNGRDVAGQSFQKPHESSPKQRLQQHRQKVQVDLASMMQMQQLNLM